MKQLKKQDSLVINTDKAGNMKKSTWKKEVKTRIKKNMQKKD